MKRFLVFEGKIDELEKQMNKHPEYEVIDFSKMAAPGKMAVIMKLNEDEELCDCDNIQFDSIEFPENMLLTTDSIKVKTKIELNGKNIVDLIDEKIAKFAEKLNKSDSHEKPNKPKKLLKNNVKNSKEDFNINENHPIENKEE